MSFPVYTSYTDSGVDWLGQVPTHWHVVQTKRQFRRRKATNAGMVCEDRLALTMNGVVPRDLDDLDGLQSSDYEGYQIFEAGDLAFKLIDLQNIRTSRVGMVPTRGIMSPAYIRLEPSTSDVARFGFWYFMALYWTQVFNNLGGGVRQTLGPEDLLTLPFPLPPAAEQVAIAAFLDRETAKIDALVEAQRRLIELLKEKRQAVISHAVTKGLDPTAPMKASGVDWLGDVPAHWDVKPLKHLVRLKSGGTPSKDRFDYWSGDIPWASAKDLKSDELASTQDFLTQAAIDERAATTVPVGTVLVLVRGMMLARIFPVCRTLTPMAINQDLKAVSGREEMSNRFLAWMLRGTAQETLARLDEAGHGTKALRMEAWLSMDVPLPPPTDQEAVAEAIENTTEQIDALVSQAEAGIALLQERRATLIFAAVTGKIDLRRRVGQQMEAA